MHTHSWVHWHTVWSPVSAWYPPISLELPLSNQALKMHRPRSKSWNRAAQYNLYQRLRTPFSPHCTRVYISRAQTCSRKAGSAPSWFKATMWPKIAPQNRPGKLKNSRGDGPRPSQLLVLATYVAWIAEVLCHCGRKLIPWSWRVETSSR